MRIGSAAAADCSRPRTPPAASGARCRRAVCRRGGKCGSPSNYHRRFSDHGQHLDDPAHGLPQHVNELILVMPQWNVQRIQTSLSQTRPSGGDTRERQRRFRGACRGSPASIATRWRRIPTTLPLGEIARIITRASQVSRQTGSNDVSPQPQEGGSADARKVASGRHAAGRTAHVRHRPSGRKAIGLRAWRSVRRCPHPRHRKGKGKGIGHGEFLMLAIDAVARRSSETVSSSTRGPSGISLSPSSPPSSRT